MFIVKSKLVDFLSRFRVVNKVLDTKSDTDGLTSSLTQMVWQDRHQLVPRWRVTYYFFIIYFEADSQVLLDPSFQLG